MLIAKLLIILTGIASVHSLPTPTNTTYTTTASTSDSTNWTRKQFIAFVTLTTIGIVVAAAVTLLLAWCEHKLERKPSDLLCCDLPCRGFERRKRVLSREEDATDGQGGEMADNLGDEMAMDGWTPGFGGRCISLHRYSRSSRLQTSELKPDTMEAGAAGAGRGDAAGNAVFETEHFDDVINILEAPDLIQLFRDLKNLTEPMISKVFSKIPIMNVPYKDQAYNVFNGWIKKFGFGADREKILNGLGKSGLNVEKTLLTNHWTVNSTFVNQKCAPNDISTIIKVGKLKWSKLRRMFLNIGLEEFEIENLREADQEDIDMKSRNMFNTWINTLPRPTIKDLLDPMEQIDACAADTLKEKWRIGTHA